MAAEIIRDAIQEVQREITARGLTADIPPMAVANPLPVYQYEELYFWNRGMAAQKTLVYEREFSYGSRLARLAKRIIRKLCRFLIKPVVEDQTEFNICTAEFSGQLVSYVLLQERRLEKLRCEMEELRQEMARTVGGEDKK